LISLPGGRSGSPQRRPDGWRVGVLCVAALTAAVVSSVAAHATPTPSATLSAGVSTSRSAHAAVPLESVGPIVTAIGQPLYAERTSAARWIARPGCTTRVVSDELVVVDAPEDLVDRDTAV